jgi:Flp pilus assembly protein TadD
MQALEPPDSHRLRAAEGWLELGNPAEAARELEGLSASGRQHPHTLEVHWRLCAARREWEQAVAVAGNLVSASPDEVTGYVHRSYALHELRRTAEARAGLLPLAERFPEFSVIPYNLACYACQLGDLAEARRWLAKAFKLRNREELQRLALADPDLKPLWREIADW